MSLIPQRKKTPEELAALRAQELASHPAFQTPPPPVDPASSSSQMPAIPDTIAIMPEENMQRHTAHASSPQTEKPVRLRKNPPMKHGQVHVFDGLRPAAAAEISAGSPGTHVPLPQRKHDDRELQELRHRGLMQTRPPVKRIMAMELHPFLSSLLYLIALIMIILTVRFWSYEGIERYYTPGAGCGSLLLISLFLYFKKPRARHHAAILSGLCLVVLGFVILLTLKNPYAP